MKAIATVLCLSLLSSCWSNDDSYSLFRSSALDGSMRVYIASFNAPDGADDGYNKENCAIAAQLFQSQPGVTVRYWCEKAT